MPSAPPWTSHSAIAGAGAGLVSSIVTCPLDVVKTKLQAQKIAHHQVGYMGVYGTVRHIAKHDGLRGFYRGLGPTLMGYLPTWAIYFYMYDGIKERFGGRHDYHSEPWSLHILAAMSAGATGTIITSPLWVIKTRFMTQPVYETKYRHTLDAFLTIYRQEGPRAFYRGLIPSLLGVTHVAVQFPLYERLKLYFAERQHVSTTHLPSSTILICSAISKMTASIATYPHEVVRTRLQIQKRYLETHHPSPHRDHPLTSQSLRHPPTYRGMVKTVGKILREEGWKGLYKGLSVNLLRTVPNSAVTLLTYELLMQYMAGTA